MGNNIVKPCYFQDDAARMCDAVVAPVRKHPRATRIAFAEEGEDACCEYCCVHACDVMLPCPEGRRHRMCYDCHQRWAKRTCPYCEAPYTAIGDH